MTATNRRWHGTSALMGLFAAPLHAAPIDGELGSNAAVLLVLLGVWALFMGMRNLRQLRHRRLIPERQLSFARREPAAEREAQPEG